LLLSCVSLSRVIVVKLARQVVNHSNQRGSENSKSVNNQDS
jgi:hypothetical protein